MLPLDPALLMAIKLFVVVSCIAFWIDLCISLSRYMSHRRDQYTIRRRRHRRHDEEDEE